MFLNEQKIKISFSQTNEILVNLIRKTCISYTCTTHKVEDGVSALQTTSVS